MAELGSNQGLCGSGAQVLNCCGLCVGQMSCNLRLLGTALYSTTCSKTLLSSLLGTLLI